MRDHEVERTTVSHEVASDDEACQPMRVQTRVVVESGANQPAIGVEADIVVEVQKADQRCSLGQASTADLEETRIVTQPFLVQEVEDDVSTCARSVAPVKSRAYS